MEKMLLVGVKMAACLVVFIAGCYFVASASSVVVQLGIGIGALITILAISNIETRDYGKEPVTDAETRQGVIRRLIDHLESEEHGDKYCDPCPVPDLLKKIDPERV